MTRPAVPGGAGGLPGLRRFLVDNARWLAAGALMTLMSSFGQTFFISIFAGEIRAAFDLSHGQWGGIYSLGTTASAAVMIWSGALTDRHRVRVLGRVVLAGSACACLFMAVNQSVWLLPLSIFLLRLFGQGMSSHIAMVAMARWFIAARGRALSVATLGFSSGEALLPVTFVSLMAWIDWRLLWVAAAGIALAGIPVLMLLLRRERTPQSHAQDHSAAGMLGRHWTRRQTLTHPLFWFMVPALLGPAAFNTAFFFHQVHFAEVKGWAHVELVAMFPAYTAMAVTAMMTAGWALDRWGTPRLMPFYQLPLVVAFLIFATVQTPVAALAGFFFLGLATGANMTLPNAFWADFYGTGHIGAIKAMAAAVMVLGTAIGPGITGAMIDLGLGLETQYVGIAAYFLFTSTMMVLGISRSRRDLPA